MNLKYSFTKYGGSVTTVVTYCYFIVPLDPLEHVGPQDAIGDDRSHQHHMGEQTGEYLPGIVDDGGTSMRPRLLFHSD